MVITEPLPPTFEQRSDNTVNVKTLPIIEMSIAYKTGVPTKQMAHRPVQANSNKETRQSMIQAK
jgi:hypothetical protein